ncbi:hypothetical protein PR003_g15574 [Phytophthora rubi]|uniref:Uncharacterized protein n=1 Tax=Phytophthora rubi TaxID=129364 RepID=A0A6A3LL65_9STRA|nr:hypothetical protein PR001_g13676 [Phytophthora rubi]KAE9039547.1 hypothetical protein PR002_g5447 [Phytophthora rubi]KAE9329378.1 hypothetical protein PR003_g15574 [Phytophthora rubi]
MGVSTLILITNCAMANGEIGGDEGLAFDEAVLVWSGFLVLTGVASPSLKWYEASSSGRLPLQMAEVRYSAWIKDVEEQEQAERLSEAFWREDGCVRDKKPVQTLSGCTLSSGSYEPR